jgi:hypothetical protein
MSRIVRQSKFRHVFGTVAKKENCYDDIKVTRTAWDSNYMSASSNFFAVCWDSAGGGSFAVIPHSSVGKVLPSMPVVNGHKNPVLDLDFNPMNDNLIVSVSEDCTAKVWGIPANGLTETLTEPLQTLHGHRRKVGSVKFHPTANNIVATSSSDYSVKLWDIEKGKDAISIDAQHSDIIQSLDWSFNGSLIATSCKDKKMRIFDPRTKSVASEILCHEGVKGSRVVWLGNKNKVLSVGFTKTSEREYCVWDPKDLSKPLHRANIDSASGVIMPFYDNDTGVLFLAGKGDGNIRYYEIVDEAPYIYYLTEFKSNTPQRGACVLPKRSVNVSECEIVRLLKLGVKTVEPISFCVPRKSDVFHDDLFPDCFSGEASITAAEYLSGKNGDPKTTSLQPGFSSKKTVAEFNPVKSQEPAPMSEKQMRDEIEKLTKRVAFLEAEMIKKDARIKELEH